VTKVCHFFISYGNGCATGRKLKQISMPIVEIAMSFSAEIYLFRRKKYFSLKQINLFSLYRAAARSNYG